MTTSAACPGVTQVGANTSTSNPKASADWPLYDFNATQGRPSIEFLTSKALDAIWKIHQYSKLADNEMTLSRGLSTDSSICSLAFNLKDHRKIPSRNRICAQPEEMIAATLARKCMYILLVSLGIRRPPDKPPSSCSHCTRLPHRLSAQRLPWLPRAMEILYSDFSQTPLTHQFESLTGVSFARV